MTLSRFELFSPERLDEAVALLKEKGKDTSLFLTTAISLFSLLTQYQPVKETLSTKSIRKSPYNLVLFIQLLFI